MSYLGMTTKRYLMLSADQRSVIVVVQPLSRMLILSRRIDYRPPCFAQSSCRCCQFRGLD